MNVASNLLVATTIALLAVLPSCAALDNVLRFTDPETGEVVETTVGNVAANAVVGLGATVSDIVSGGVGLATGNTILGAGAGAAIITLVAAGAARLRRKKD